MTMLKGLVDPDTGRGVTMETFDVNSYIGSPLIRATGAPILLANDTVVDSYDIELVGGHGYVPNDLIFIANTTRSFQAKILSVNVNTLTLDAPIDHIFTVGTTVTIKFEDNMKVDGSVTPIEFGFGLGATATKGIRMTGLRIIIASSGSMDDSTFGDLSALTRGIVLKQTLLSGEQRNLFNAKTNGGLGLIVNNKQYTAKAGGGENAVEFGWDLVGETNSVLEFGVSDRLDLIIQDDLSTLTAMSAWIYGTLFDL